MRLPLMVACGLREEAIEQARAHAEGGTWYAARSSAEFLTDAGRTAEAVAVLEQHAPADSSILARHLIVVAPPRVQRVEVDRHVPHGVLVLGEAVGAAVLDETVDVRSHVRILAGRADRVRRVFPATYSSAS
ncbi:hypothetical protein [Kitasatospora aureofaciens]|uniref:hypothetical protein n=1 Tax=Kitasatospora aureofaciens TaxID=1894 RepID=UPI001C457697|nr:hypothetical protein [Kitasatospora aureofaciens]MBV6697307.1 hypothetical protein [Kitasatospora aureofaciens]